MYLEVGVQGWWMVFGAVAWMRSSGRKVEMSVQGQKGLRRRQVGRDRLTVPPQGAAWHLKAKQRKGFLVTLC